MVFGMVRDMVEYSHGRIVISIGGAHTPPIFPGEIELNSIKKQ